MELLPEQTFPANQDLDKPNKEYTDLLHLNLDENNREIQKRLTGNSGSIDDNTEDIATNTTGIATNVTGISTNVTDIATNASDITDLQGKGYVDRGDSTAIDFDQTDLATQDNTWNDLDLDSGPDGAIIPATAKAVLFRVRVLDGDPNIQLFLRENGNSNAFNISAIRTQVGGISNDGDMIVSCDSNKVIEYRISAALTTISLQSPKMTKGLGYPKPFVGIDQRGHHRGS